MKLENNALWIKDARLGFPSLLQPKAVQGGEPKYSCNFILAPTAPEWAEMGQIISAMAVEKWGDQANAVLTMIKADKRLRCYGQGAEKISQKTGQVYDGFQGMVFISAANTEKPKLYGTDATELPPTANANQLFVGGNYVSGIISFWTQDNQFGRGIRANLDGVQYIREGEHFGTPGPETDGVFQPVPGAPAPAPTAPVPGGVAPVAPAPVTPGGLPSTGTVPYAIDPLS